MTNLAEITTTDTGLPSLTVTGTTELQGSTTVGSGGKSITFGGQPSGGSKLAFRARPGRRFDSADGGYKYFGMSA